jgi:hypothetical protein
VKTYSKNILTDLLAPENTEVKAHMLLENSSPASSYPEIN